MSDPSKIPLYLLTTTSSNSGWLEWDGSKFFVSPVPSGMDEDSDNPGGKSGVLEFRTPGSRIFTPQEGQEVVTAVIVAGGGGGAGGGLFSNPAGGGGQAGEVKVVEINTENKPIEINVGIGGLGGSPQSKGQRGSDSSVGLHVAAGGLGGSHCGSLAPIAAKIIKMAPNTDGAKHLFALSMGGGNNAAGHKRMSDDHQFGKCGFNAQTPHKNGGSGGSNQLSAGGNGGVFSPAGSYGSIVSNGSPGFWPGAGGGGAGSNECETGGFGGAGEDGVVWIFWGDAFAKRFPNGIEEISAFDRAGLSVGIDLWYKEAV